MNIEEIRQEKTQLEMQMKKLLNEFHKKTGCTVKDIDVDNIDITNLKSVEKEYITKVTTHVELS